MKKIILDEKHWIRFFHIIDAEIRKTERLQKRYDASQALDAKIKQGVIKVELETLNRLRDFAITNYVETPESPKQ